MLSYFLQCPHKLNPRKSFTFFKMCSSFYEDLRMTWVGGQILCHASKNASKDFCQSSTNLYSRTGGVMTELEYPELNTALHLPARIFCQIHQKPTQTPGWTDWTFLLLFSSALIMNPLGVRDELMVFKRSKFNVSRKWTKTFAWG